MLLILLPEKMSGKVKQYYHTNIQHNIDILAEEIERDVNDIENRLLSIKNKIKAVKELIQALNTAK